MKSMVLLALALTLSVPAHAAPIALSKAAELGLHRIERLVTLNKIDRNFIDRFYGISAAKLTPGQPTDPAFKVSGIQVPGADGKSHQVDILMDAAGKALSNAVINGSEPVNPPRWGSVDPLAISENSFHYLIDNGMAKPELKPFFTDFSTMALTQVQDAQGQPQALATIKSSASPKVLEIRLKLDGSVVSATVK
jgi:hypothetical protein